MDFSLLPARTTSTLQYILMSAKNIEYKDHAVILNSPSIGGF
jgi:hypothetical protein